MVTAAVIGQEDFLAIDFETWGRRGPDIVTEGAGEIGFLDAAIFLEHVKFACGVVGPDMEMEREEVVGFETRGIVAADLVIDSLGVVGLVEIKVLDRAGGVLGEGTLAFVGRGPLNR